jgi:hypothetical protein
MNEHILLVMKWLNDAESVSREELESNYESAYYAYYGADADWAAYRAAYRAAYYASADTTYWVNEYFKVTGEDKQIYIDKLGE